MTNWADIYTAAMTWIDDVRLTEQLSISPALYSRRMSLFVLRALPMLNKPPELLDYLTSGMTEPDYDDYEWQSTVDSTTAETTVQTGMTGYDLCSCVIVEYLDDGRVLQTPYEVTYDGETGNVVFPVQKVSGITYELDFYKDGSFYDLSDSQMRLFGLALALVWEERFYANWLNRQPKINDSSFSTVNEANYIEKTSQALNRARIAFYDALRDYEQTCAYNKTVTKYPAKVVLV